MPRKPAKPVLPLHDQRMLDLMDYVVKEEIDGLRTQTMALAAIGFNQANLSQLKLGKQSFGVHHIAKAVETFGVDANYFFLKKHTRIMNDHKKRSAISELKAAVARVAEELKKQ